jgi:hypothetical protein
MRIALGFHQAPDEIEAAGTIENALEMCRGLGLPRVTLEVAHDLLDEQVPDAEVVDDETVEDDDGPQPLAHSPLGMSPDAMPIHQFCENVAFLVDRTREIEHQIDAGIELRSLSNGDHESVLASLALVEQMIDRLRKELTWREC